MGVTSPAARFLVDTRLAGASFERTLTLGRQQLFVSPRRLARMLERNGLWPQALTREDFYRSFTASPGHVEPFLRCLGAEQVDSLDASAYEDAEIVHDLNLPVPSAWHERYSLVFDGGTLEHVFNFPQALSSCMRMVRTGGHLVLYAVANNMFGHGFYQFSPELFFRTLTESNGFRIDEMLVWEELLGASRVGPVPYSWQSIGPAHRVRDSPFGDRHGLINRRPSALILRASKLAHVEPFVQYPQQSDYEATWTRASEPSPRSRPAGLVLPLVQGALRRLPPHVKSAIWFDLLPRVMRPLDPWRERRWVRRWSFHNGALYEPHRFHAESGAGASTSEEPEES